MFKFITKQHFLVNLLVAVLLVVFIIVLFFNSLDWLTHHNEVVKVPSVTGRNIDDATKVLAAQGFEVEVQDSIYIDTAAKSSVIRQSPDADAVVKKNRTIYLTINRSEAPLVDVPDLRGFSFQSAQMYLQSLGLKLGDTSYVPDIARNSVREQRYNDKVLQPGTKISMGSAISLVLGDGIGNASMSVPNLIGMTLTDAQGYLSSLNIGIGAIVPDADVQDKGNAFIYRQNPPVTTISGDGSSSQNRIHPGEVIDVYLSATAPVTVDSTTAPSQPQ